MNTTTAATLAASFALLAACAQHGRHHEQDRHEHDHGGKAGHEHPYSRPQADMGGAQTFRCENGLSVQVQNAGEEKVRISVKGSQTVLTQAPSASGERYVGKAGEWHQKGGEAHFTYAGLDGAKGETSCKRD